jgi:sporulation protein YlmC with PRC-barrel domain
MLRSIKDLEGYAIRATDGDVGHVRDFYFDDATWVIRYLVVDTGSWLSHRKVLISPIATGHANDADKELPASLTMEQVKSSPDIDTERPVSRRQEMYYLLHYGYPQYWGGVGLWGDDMHPPMAMPEFSSTPRVIEPQLDDPPSLAEATLVTDEDPHLRAFNDLKGYRIVASDGDIGHVQGMLIDEDTWAIRYLIVDTSNWWLGHQVLIAPQWIERVSWGDETVTVELTQQAVQDAPPYDAAVGMDRQGEETLWTHHGRTAYWVDEPDRVRIASPR